MKKIALVFLGDYLYDARCYNMFNTFKKYGHPVSIYNYQPLNTSNNQTNIINIALINLPFIKYILWTYKIYMEIKKSSYDIIVASDLYSLIPICLASPKTQIIYDSREIYRELSVHQNNPIKRTIIKLCEKYCVSKIKKIIVTAQSDKKYLKSVYKNKILYKTVYNFPSKKNIYKRSSYLRTKLKIPKNHIILLYQGAIQKNRGIMQLIKIIKNTENTTGVIIGSGEYRKHINTFIIQSKLTKRIFCLKAFSYKKLLKISSSADIGVALIKPCGTSNKYALPNKLFEYALSGLPTIASNLPNMNEYIKKYNLGWSVNPHNLNQQIQIVSSYKKNIRTKNNSLNVDALSWEFQEASFYNYILS